ncbi:MAG: PAS domain-containing sensor histidine kinase [Alphaproteobacteria bacterium]|nr:PAS domain-containing sensor histidine kinase [Alphaproteobacteria bacterium]MBT5860850.1 PAS domain-containing sensor histidine kinase [Alphaproteobacteria bacterium]
MATESHFEAPPRSRIMGWARALDLGRNLPVGLAIAAFFSGVATYAALTGSSPFGPDPQTVQTLLLVDLVLVLLLGVVVSIRLVRLWIQRRRDIAGARLHTRIVGLFSLVAVAPAIIVAVFSALFFNFGIESWFSERVGTALDESVAVADAYLIEHRNQVRGEVLSMAGELNRQAGEIRNDPVRLRQMLATEAAIHDIPEAIVFQRDGTILARAGLTFSMEFDLLRDIPANLDRAAQGEVVVLTKDDDERVRALIRLDRWVDTYLYVGRLVDAQVLVHAGQTRSAVAEYQRLEDERSRIQITFVLIYIVVALLLLLAAVWVGLVFASRLINPVSTLIRAAEKVRGGDLGARVPEGPADDELASLGRAFNRMTSQLESQRSELMEANQQLNTRRRFTEAVLSGVSSGVIGLDTDGNINLPNRSAIQLLNVSADSLIGEPFSQAVPEMAPLLAEARERPGRKAQAQVNMVRGARPHVLMVRVTADRKDDAITGFVVTFDDVTELVAAQRSAAWSDIARRIAHEIKNPLTPIQLSAERLKRKYMHEIGTDPEVFRQCTETIIRQVSDIGRMIDEFSSFARMPAPVFHMADLVEVARQGLFLQQVAHPGVEYTTEFPADAVDVYCDSRQVAQVLTNLLLNAAEAISGRDKPDDGSELPSGKIILRVTAGADEAMLEVLDNGRGLPEEDRNRLTEPYVSTRLKGTGLGLAIVAKVMEDHKGTISIEDRAEGGACVRLVFPRGDHDEIDPDGDSASSTPPIDVPAYGT